MNTFGKNKNKFNASARYGQALIEVMIAVGILTVGFLGIVGLLSRALALNRVVADNYTATYLAAEGIEITKNIIDGNIIQQLPWNTFPVDCNDAGGGNGGCQVEPKSNVLSPYTGRTLVFDPDAKLYDYSGAGAQTTFRRRITIEMIGANELKVESQVTWITRGGGTSEVVLEDHFYAWR